MKTIEESVQLFVEERYDYFRNWTLDKPFIFDDDSLAELQHLQKLMYRLVVHFVENYNVFKHLMPVSDKVEEILKSVSNKKYHPGTYRTDFVFDKTEQFKIIEITCRFALNGMFQTAVFNNHVDKFLQNEYSESECDRSYEGIYDHLYSILECCDQVVVITGDDQKNESKIFLDILKNAGYQTSKINYKRLPDVLGDFDKALIIPELSFDEICSLDIEVITELNEHKILNDFRTIFLIHDKRFFSVLGDHKFLQSILSEDEIQFFKKFYIPTYTITSNDELWKEIAQNKDDWIIKHRALGKSQSVYAGPVTDEKEWESILSSIEVGEFVVQKWIPQKTYKATVKGEEVNDFLTGTLLFFDDNFFGLGEFRTSSFPVTNKTDHRKAAGLFLKNSKKNLKQYAN